MGHKGQMKGKTEFKQFQLISTKVLKSIEVIWASLNGAEKVIALSDKCDWTYSE